MRKSLFLLTMIFVVVFVLAACGGKDESTATPVPAANSAAVSATAAPAPAAAKGDATQGQTSFLMTCAACHGPEGKGVKNLGKDMTVSTFIAGKSDDDLLAFVKTGRSIDDPLNTTGVLMPPKGGNPAMTDDELRNIIAFIRTINKAK